MSEKDISHWMMIISAVFHAENAISKEWIPKLKAAKELETEEKEKIADEYLRALAVEILSKEKEED